MTAIYQPGRFGRAVLISGGFLVFGLPAPARFGSGFYIITAVVSVLESSMGLLWYNEIGKFFSVIFYYPNENNRAVYKENGGKPHG